MRWRTTRQIPTLRRRQLQSLLPVDRAVERIVRALEETGRLEDTMIVFMSDNGYAWGEHRWKNKQTAYEHDIRVPMIIRYDRLGLSPRTEDRLVLNVDVAPTLAALSGITLPRPEGRDLGPVLHGSGGRWRTDFLIEHRQDEGVFTLPSYCAVRDERFLYVRYFTLEEELYDLRADPSELRNVARDPPYRAERDRLRQRLRELCDRPPPDAPEGFPP
ncbi:MAG: sulfatase-like hydrolase/transferase [Actinobacteria bacterium]|nr:sulfatase-like hydrolase/transferase [Actinomycetota bacterium]